jgi:hypothetical protein
MIEILLIGLVLVVTVTLAFVVWLAVRQFDAQRKEWAAERSKLLDRVQAGSLMEYKQQERADRPKEKKERDPLSKEPWA